MQFQSDLWKTNYNFSLAFCKCNIAVEMKMLLTSCSSLVQCIPKIQNFLHNFLQFIRVPNLTGQGIKMISMILNIQLQKHKIVVPYRHTSSHAEFTMSKLFLTSEIWEKREANNRSWNYHPSTFLDKMKKKCNNITCVPNWILKENTLNLASTLGTFINSRKNCSTCINSYMIF